MTLLDTDMLSLYMDGHAQVTERIRKSGVVAITVVTQIEILQGRFASVLKAADGDRLLSAQSGRAATKKPNSPQSHREHRGRPS